MGIETRKVTQGVYVVGGRPVVKAEFDRINRGTVVTMLDRNEIERRYHFDLLNWKDQPAIAVHP